MRRTLVRIVAGLLLASCAQSGVGRDPAPPTPTEPPIGAWQLRSSVPTIEVPGGGSPITLTVEAVDGQLRLGGVATCNTYDGTLELDGDSWSVRDLASTMIGCTPDLMEAERAFLDALRTADRYRSDGDGFLILTGPGNGGLGTGLTFEPRPPAVSADLLDTTQEVTGFVTETGWPASRRDH